MAKLLRIVNDTNVWLSALYFAGKPAQIVHLIEQKEIISVTSEFILNETRDKMIEKFDTPVGAANATTGYIASISQIVNLSGRDFNLRDVADNQVLETAVLGKCDFLITGDKDLLELEKYQDLQILPPHHFLAKYNK